MSEDHEWCRDPARDEAVRAAEDAAAVPSIQHRDLPEQVALLWASLGDIIGRVVRLEGEMDAGQDEEAAPAVCDSASPANGLRTERVTPPWQRAKWDEALAIICDGGDWGRGNNFDHGVLGALVIWADKEMDRLTAERDAALRERDAAKEECERLRHLLKTKESECETHHPWVHPSAAPAANAGGDAKPVLWGVVWGHKDLPEDVDTRNTKEEALNLAKSDLNNGTVIPLYDAPQPPRGWLTDEEREAVRWIIDFARHHAVPSAAVAHCHFKTAEALLARSTPPRVRRPNPNVVITTVDARERIDRQWIDAIRAAGGEVE